jgi:putative peptidoglycan lipid II flippase
MTESELPADLTPVTPAAPAPEAVTARPTGERAAGMVAAGIMVSRVFGLLRTWAFARYFGAGVAADAYNAAVKIPNFVRTLLGEGAISASFIPVYTEALERGDERGARSLAGAVLGILLAAVSVLTIVGILLAPALVGLVAGGLNAESEALAIRLTRIMFPMTGLMVLSGWCLAIQNSHRRFFMSYASAALWSLAQIVLLFGWGTTATAGSAPPPLFGLAARIGDPTELAWWLAWATLAGAVLQIGAQLPQVIALVRPMRISLDRAVPGVAKTLRNFGPVVLALSAVQISSFIDTRIASQLPTGAIANINYAAQLYTLPVSLFGLSVAAASLPDFSRDTLHATNVLRDRLRLGWVRILFYIIPSTLVFVLYGDLVITLLLRSGRFGQEETELVHWVLAAYAIGLVGYSSVKLLASAHYAFNDYRTPLRASVFAIITSAILALSLALPFRHSLRGAAGIALGSALGSYVNLALLAVGLRKRVGPLYDAVMWKGTLRIIGATAIASAVAYPVRRVLETASFIPDRWRPYVVALGTLAAFGGIFLVAAYAAGSLEAARWLRSLRVVRRAPS